MESTGVYWQKDSKKVKKDGDRSLKMKQINRKETNRERTRIQRKTDTEFYIAGWVLIAVIACYVLSNRWLGFDIRQWLFPCLFHQMTGYDCPGCGGTRAVAALVSGKIIEAFCYHPFVVYAAGAAAWFMLSQTMERLSKGKIRIGMHYHDRYLWIGLIIIIINFVLKNAALYFWRTDLLHF